MGIAESAIISYRPLALSNVSLTEILPCSTDSFPASAYWCQHNVFHIKVRHKYVSSINRRSSPKKLKEVASINLRKMTYLVHLTCDARKRKSKAVRALKLLGVAVPLTLLIYLIDTAYEIIGGGAEMI